MHKFPFLTICYQFFVIIITKIWFAFVEEILLYFYKTIMEPDNILDNLELLPVKVSVSEDKVSVFASSQVQQIDPSHSAPTTPLLTVSRYPSKYTSLNPISTLRLRDDLYYGSKFSNSL